MVLAQFQAASKGHGQLEAQLGLGGLLPRLTHVVVGLSSLPVGLSIGYLRVLVTWHLAYLRESDETEKNQDRSQSFTT